MKFRRKQITYLSLGAVILLAWLLIHVVLDDKETASTVCPVLSDQISRYLESEKAHANYLALQLIGSSRDDKYINDVASFLTSKDIAYIPVYAKEGEPLAGIDIGFDLAYLKVKAAYVLIIYNTEESLSILRSHINQTQDREIVEFIKEHDFRGILDE